MEVLLIKFSKFVFFIDGNKNRRWRPQDPQKQEEPYDGYKKCHAWSIAAFTDTFGCLFPLEITNVGSKRRMYVSSNVFREPEQFLSTGQHGVADMGYTSDGDIFEPFKKTQVHHECTRLNTIGIEEVTGW